MAPDREQLEDDLFSYRADLELPGVREELVRAALPRLLATLEMVPDECLAGDFLELGSSPYFLTLCLRRAVRGRLALANFFGTGEKKNRDRLTHRRTGEQVVFESDLFNIETEDFPYPDESFDVVLFSELIEHLVLNPVRALSEIHRVLRPGGRVVITTPNALSIERLDAYRHGGSRMVDRYSPLFGPGARHNREYHPRELRELLEGCGFTIEALDVRDLERHSLRERVRRVLWRYYLLRTSADRREEHIFLRARRGERFRWSFPPSLFDNITFYVLVRHPWVEMGINDSIQTGEGWHPLEKAAAGTELRRIDGVGQAFLKAPAGPLVFGMEAFAAASAAPAPKLSLVVWDRWLGRVKEENRYVVATVALERGRWQTIEVPLGRHPQPGDECEVRIDAGGEGGVAVRRIWFRAAG